MKHRFGLSLVVAGVLLALLAACVTPVVVVAPTATPDVDMEQIAATRGGYSTACYREQGGAKFVCESGGEIELQSGATLDVQSGVSFSGDLTGDLSGDVTSTGSSSFVTMTVTGPLTASSGVVIDGMTFTYTEPITISGVLTNVRLLYYQVP